MNQEPEKFEDQNPENQNNSAAGAETAGAEAAAKKDGEKYGFKLACSMYDFVEMFAIALIAVMMIFTFCIRICKVDGGSMKNTLQDKETLIISDAFYTPKQGDIVVFHLSNEHYQQPLVKRVIATESQTVFIDLTEQKVYVDGEELKEDYAYLDSGVYQPHGYFDQSLLVRDERGHLTYSVTVPEGKLFVMGDNRNHSSDSRSASVGLVDESTVLGKAFFNLSTFSPIE